MQEKANHFTQIVMASKSDKELLAIQKDFAGYDEDSRAAATTELESRKEQRKAAHASAGINLQNGGQGSQDLESYNVFVPKTKPGAVVAAVAVQEEDLLLPYPKEDLFVLASGTKRFANLIIDYIAAMVFVMFAAASISVFAELFENEALQEAILILENVLSFLWYFGYYVFFEFVVSGKTIGKMITRTRVVDEYGDKPGIGKIIGRTFARMIPFDAFTFLGEDARGWHDSLSGTIVIDEKKSILRSDWL